MTSVITTELISFSACCRALLMLSRMERLLVRATQPLRNTLSGYQGKECSCLEKLELVGSFLHHLMHLSTTRLLAESIKWCRGNYEISVLVKMLWFFYFMKFCFVVVLVVFMLWRIEQVNWRLGRFFVFVFQNLFCFVFRNSTPACSLSLLLLLPLLLLQLSIVHPAITC